MYISAHVATKYVVVIILIQCTGKMFILNALEWRGGGVGVAVSRGVAWSVTHDSLSHCAAGTRQGRGRGALFFFGARIWLGTILGRFSINYFSGLGLRIITDIRI